MYSILGPQDSLILCQAEPPFDAAQVEAQGFKGRPNQLVEETLRTLPGTKVPLTAPGVARGPSAAIRIRLQPTMSAQLFQVHPCW